ncbi:MAG: hypothetical protein BGO70_15675 [Bacteroidetes bacterium 43-93]|nr:hypothetical protein [Bacteroidota bacterium]OJX01213.1 MAG: hypothetical protein BGO70_15675 [Bacteroidetes bacterium 43-93]
MKKALILTTLIIISAHQLFAQTNSSATQKVNLNLSDAIEITYYGSGSGSGNGSVNLAFNTVNDYANGVVSWDEHYKVRSNKNFKVSVKANAANFTYVGSASPTPVMPVSGVLDLIVTSNTTGGSVASPFTLNTSWAGLSSAMQDLISNGSRGGDQMFAVKYRATPGFNYPAGNYTIDVVYTATQL